MIDKNFIEVVLEVDIERIELPRDFLDSNTDMLTIWFNDSERSRIGIHDLIFKIEEWAWDNGFVMITGRNIDIDLEDQDSYSKYATEVYVKSQHALDEGIKCASIGGDTKLEPTLFAGGWILKQLQRNKV